MMLTNIHDFGYSISLPEMIWWLSWSLAYLSSILNQYCLIPAKLLTGKLWCSWLLIVVKWNEILTKVPLELMGLENHSEEEIQSF